MLPPLAHALRDRTARGAGVESPESFVIGVVPENGFRVTRLPAERRRRFRDFLRGIIARAAESRAAGRDCEQSTAIADGSVADDPVAAEPPSSGLDAAELDAALGRACARCRGHCCTTADDHAYLAPDIVRRRLDACPEQGVAGVLESYMSYLPRYSYDRSCVYHTTRGCALPREMRSDTCNRFLCNGLKQLRDGLRAAGTTRSFVVTTRQRQPTGAAFVDAREVRVVRRRELRRVLEEGSQRDRV